MSLRIYKCHLMELNQRPEDFQSSALPAELKWRVQKIKPTKKYGNIYIAAPPYFVKSDD
jgi:hypothetical protein